ncbi:hypothetical protein [Sporosarcina sp. HYO08]|uniref:hypothetical protein n=1 Tax=Sporosarcina sp. HYO08 TaxID=1759557 RepID=UPI000794E1E8|nr:hypothetical protein [Sporosarcina sp. HYO08]KXH81766.1 hypothetical protein AU377_05735 [Sporosarcina sp. HYO08]
MKRLHLFIYLLLAVVIFAGCSKTSTNLNNSGESTGTATKEDETVYNGVDGKNADQDNGETKDKTDAEISMLDFFLPDGTKAHFKGEGNEFASLDIDVAHPYENYIIVHENNGGALVQRVYKIQDHQIYLLDTQAVDMEQDFPSLADLDAMTPAELYIDAPLTKGKNFGNWTVVDTNVSVETPYKTFDDATVIEMKEKDSVNRKYFVPGFGEVKRETIMDLEEGEVAVTSMLETIYE